MKYKSLKNVYYTSLYSYDGVLSDDSISSISGSNRAGLFLGVEEDITEGKNDVSFRCSSW